MNRVGRAKFSTGDGGNIEIVTNPNNGEPLVCFDVRDLFGNRAVFTTTESGVADLFALIGAALAEAKS